MSYQDNEIFEPKLNAICDYILQLIQEAFPEVENEENIAVTQFVLSGRAASIRQKEEFTEIHNVIFHTINESIFKWCYQKLPTLLFNCKAVKFQDRLLIYPQDYFIEIWFGEIANYETLLNGVNCLLLNLIPEESL
jgi:hypothetical protein